MAMSECLRESLGLLEIIKVVKPIHHLAEAMIEARTPFRSRLRAGLLEDAVLMSVFKFDDAEFSFILVPQEHVCRKITEERVLEGQLSSRSDVGRKSSHEGR